MLDSISLLGAPIGAFAAAWVGAHLGFRRTRKERALDRVVAWHVEVIQALARYEEKLKRLHGYSRNVLVVQRVQNAVQAAADADIPRTIRIPERLWQDLRDAEEPLRAALHLAAAYTDLRTEIECSTALSSIVNIVSDQWDDLSPEPEVAWAGWSGNAIRIASLRYTLVSSLKKALELDGILGSVWPAAARWRLVWRIKREQQRLARQINRQAA
jgi:hypothetical protein